MVRSPNAAMRIFRRISGGRCWKRVLSDVAVDEAPRFAEEGVGDKARLRDAHGDRSSFGPSGHCPDLNFLLRSFAVFS
jgi:hypothetical protein